MFKFRSKLFSNLYFKLLKSLHLIQSESIFEKYFKAQKIVSHLEWDLFLKYLNQNLPLTIRIDQDFFDHYLSLQVFFKNKGSLRYFHPHKEKSGIKDEKFFQKMKILNWYPNQLAYQINQQEKMSREFEYFLRTERFAGGLFTQETVSLLPVLLLKVKPDDKVLDMCASPGSKSTQILQMFSKIQLSREGFLIANDVNDERVKILVNQSKKYFNPNLIITKCNAYYFPELLDSNGEKMYFDRILCDVPCSGSGTIRKHCNIFKEWTPEYSYTFHLKQLKIAKRAAYLLKTNGIMVYSTCSFDPIENEAVISALLSSSKGSLYLIDINQHYHCLSSFKFSKGLSTWKVMLSNQNLVSSYDQVPNEDKDKIFETMFPNLNNHSLNLEKCLRVLPHHQNTGGFFIAVIKKKDNLNFTRPLNLIKNKSIKKMQSIQQIKPDDQDWLRIKSYYEINDQFPDSQLYYRSAFEHKTCIYLVNQSTQNFINSNINKLNYYNFGVNVFSMFSKKDPGFRLVQEGLPGILPFMSGKRIIEINQMQLESILLKKKPHDWIKEIHPGDGCYVLLCKFKLNHNQIINVPFSAAIFQNTIIPFVNFNQKLHILRTCGLTNV